MMGRILRSPRGVMDELAKVGAKATFFAVGDNVRKFPQIAKQVVANGHRLEKPHYASRERLAYETKTEISR